MNELNTLINENVDDPNETPSSDVKTASDSPEIEDIASKIEDDNNGTMVTSSDYYPQMDFSDADKYGAPVRAATESFSVFKNKLDLLAGLTNRKAINKVAFELADKIHGGKLSERFALETFTDEETKVNYDAVVDTIKVDLTEQGKSIRDTLFNFTEKVETDIRALDDYLSTEGIENLQEGITRLRTYLSRDELSITDSKNTVLDVGGEFINIQSTPVLELNSKDLTASELLYQSQINNYINGIIKSINSSLALFIEQTLRGYQISYSARELDRSVEEANASLTLMDLEAFFKIPSLSDNVNSLVDMLTIAKQDVNDAREILNGDYENYLAMLKAFQEKISSIYDAISALRYVYYVSDGLHDLILSFESLEEAVNPLL